MKMKTFLRGKSMQHRRTGRVGKILTWRENLPPPKERLRMRSLMMSFKILLKKTFLMKLLFLVCGSNVIYKMYYPQKILTVWLLHTTA